MMHERKGRREIHVLMLSRDPSLADGHRPAPGDSVSRHALYTRRLRKGAPGSEIRILTYSSDSAAPGGHSPCPGLLIVGTRSAGRILYLVDCVRRLPEVLRGGWRPTVVTTQHPWEEGVLGYVLARVMGAKFVPQLHLELFSGSWAAESLLNWARRKVSEVILRRADLVRVVSIALGKEISRKLGIPIDRVRVIPVCMGFPCDHEGDLGTVNPWKREFAGRKVVLYAGRFVEAKDLQTWVEVAARVKKKIREAKFIMAGAGPLFEEIRTRVRDLDLESDFRFPGHLRPADLAHLYAVADVFLLTSSNEGFGRVLVESYFAGVPAVSTVCSGPQDIIVDGVTGALRLVGDVEGLASAVIDLLGNDNKRRAYGAAGHRRVVELFDPVRLADEMARLWRDA